MAEKPTKAELAEAFLDAEDLKNQRALNAEVKDFVEYLRDAFDISKKITKQYDAAKVEVKSIKDQLTQARSELLGLESSLSDARDTLVEYERLQQDSVANLTRLQTLQAESNARLDEYNNKWNQNSAIISRLQQERIDAEQIIDGLAEGILDREKEIRDEKIKQLDIARDIAENQREKTKLQQESTANQATQTDLARQLVTLEETRRTTGENTAHLDEMIADARSRYNEAVEHGNFLSEKQRQAEEDGVALVDEYGRSVNKRLIAEGKLEVLQRSRTAILDENIERSNQINNKLAENAVLERKITGEMENQANLEKQIVGETKNQKNLAILISDQKKTILGLETQIQAKLQEIADLTKQLNVAKFWLNFWKLVQIAYERFQKLDEAAESFRRNTGFSVDQMKELRKDVEKVNVDFADMGVSVENAYKSAQALANVFERTSLISKEAITNVSLLSSNLGVSEEISATVLENFMGIGDATEKAAFDAIKFGAAMSEKTGVSFAKVMDDVSKATSGTINMIGAAPMKLMKAAIAARALGLDINKIAASQRKLLDFTSSINDELELSALLGKSISFQKARQLAYEGKSEESMKEVLKTVKAAGNFEKMNVYQREQLAKASGMDLKDLTKAMAVDKQRRSILYGTDEAKKKILKAQEKELDMMKKRSEAEENDIIAQQQKQLQQQRMQAIMTKLKNIMESIVIAFADILEPIITPLMEVIVPALRIVSVLAKVFGFVLKALLTPITYLAKGIGEIAKKVDGVVSVFRGFGESTTKTVGIILGTIGAIGAAILLATGGWRVFSGMASGALEMVTGKLGGMKEAIGDVLKKGLEKITGPKDVAVEVAGGAASAAGSGAATAAEGAAAASRSAEAVKPSVGKRLKEFLQELAEGLKSMAGMQVLKGAFNLIPAGIGLTAMIPGSYGAKKIADVDGKAFSKGIKGIAAGLELMGESKVIKGALNMVVAAIGLTAMIPGAIGARMIQEVDSKKFKQAMEGISKGLESMGAGKVIKGALNMVVAAIGLTAMIPGAIGARMIQTIDAEKFKTSMVGISEGLASMGGSKITAGAGNMALAAVGLTAMIPGAAGAKMIETINAEKFKEGIGGIAEGLEKMGSGKVLRGSANMLVAAIGLAAMVPGALAARAIQTIDTEKFKEGIQAISKGLEKMAGSKVIRGSLNMLIASIGLTAMVPGALGAKMIQNIDAEKFKEGIQAISDGLAKMSGSKVIRGAISMSIAAAGLVVMIPGVLGAKMVQNIDSKKFKNGIEAISEGLSKMAGSKVIRGAINMAISAMGLTVMIPGALGAKMIQSIDSKKFKNAIEGIAAGLEQMAKSKVIRGALNMVVASVGLTAMIAGAIGAKLTQTVDGEKFKTSMKGIAEGIEEMGKGKVIRGAINMVVAAVGLTAMITGAIGARLVQSVDGEKFKEGMKGIAKGIESMATGKVLLGSLAMGVAAIGLTAMIPGALAAALLGVIGKPIELGLKFFAAGIGHMAKPQVFLGALGMAAVGISLIPFAFAMKMFGDVDWGAVGLGALALIGFTAAAFGLGAIMMSGVGAAVFGAGVIAIAALGAALVPFGIAALAAGAGVKMLGEGISSSVDPILRLAEIDLTNTAMGIGAVGLALASFGAGSAAAGLGSFVGNLLGGDPIAKMEKLASMAPGLQIAAQSINSISESLNKFAAADQFAKSVDTIVVSLEKMKEAIDDISVVKLAAIAAIGALSSKDKPEKTEEGTDAGATGGSVPEKLDAIYNALVEGKVAVYMDGVKVSKTLATASA